MTANQIAYAAHKENQRSNKAKEQETHRSNVENEATARRNARSNERNARSNERNARSNERNADSQAVRAVTGGIADVSKAIGSINDPSWYSTNPSAINAAANVSLLTPKGTKLVLDDNTGFVQPGIAIYDYVPVLPHHGFTVDPNFMRAFQSMYMQIRKANSGAKNYSVANVAQWVMAAQSIITLYVEGVRALHTAMTFKSENRYYGEGLTRALGWNFDVLQGDYAVMATYLNTVRKIIEENIPVPQTMPWFIRSIWLAGNVFADSDSGDRSNIIAFRPSGYYTYGDVELFSKFNLRPSSYTLNDYMTTLNQMIDAMLFSEDAGTMAGDILKAFPNAHFKLPEASLDGKITPVYNELVITQFKNATIVPLIPDSDGSTYDIIENSDGTLNQYLRGAGWWCPTGADRLKTDESVVIGGKPVYSHKLDIRGGELAEAMMLMSMFTYTNPTSGVPRIFVMSCGTEIVTSLTYYTSRNEANFELTPTAMGWINQEYANTMLQVSQVASQFESCPTTWITRRNGGTGKFELQTWHMMQGTKYYAPISKNVYDNIMGVAVASLLGL